MQGFIERQCVLQDRDEIVQLAAIMTDVDHFKAVNDDHGHMAGDEVLKQVAQILQRCSRKTVETSAGQGFGKSGGAGIAAGFGNPGRAEAPGAIPRASRT